MLGAQGMSAGKVLYVDFWDLKQPGVFLFHLVAGQLFGFSEVGLHLFELGYLLLFSAILLWTLRPTFATPWFSCLVPIATVGAYYVAANTWHQTQLEMLVAFPLYLALWLVSTPWAVPQQRLLAWFLSGCCAGLTVVFKMILGPIPVAFWLLSVLTEWRHQRPRFAVLLGARLFPALCGISVVLLIVAAWFWHHGALPALLWTSFIVPVEAAAAAQHKAWSVLAQALRWFWGHFALWIGLAVVGVYSKWGEKKNLIAWQMLVWLLVGLVVIVLQKLSWWPYHFLLLIVPVGVLAVYGIEKLATIWGRKTPWAPTCLRLLAIGLTVIALACGGLRSWAYHAQHLARSVFSSAPVQVRQYQLQISNTYAEIWRETRFLTTTDALPGPIYVFGDPLYLLLSGREQAIAIHGWSWELLPPSLWEMLPGQLAAAMPPYIFVENFYLPYIAKHSAPTRALLETAYTPMHATSQGTWYRRH